MLNEIKLEVNCNRFRIRFTHQGIRHQMYFGPADCPAAKALGDQIRSEVYLARLQGTFTGLEPWESRLGRTMLELTDHAALLTARLAKRYSDVEQALIHLLKAFGKPIGSTRDAQAFVQFLETERKLKASSLKRYLETLKAIDQANFGPIKLPRLPKRVPKPFSPDEIRRILNTFQTSEYYAGYYGYVLCGFSTGMRPSEIIGLRWSDISLETREIKLTSSLARGKSQRYRKTTKTQDERVIPMTPELYDYLNTQIKPRNPDELIFKSPCGWAISDQNFARRAWRKCLRCAGVTYRCPYTMRSTWISLLIKSRQKSLAEIALLAGTSQEMILKHYSGVYASDTGLPKLF